MNTNPIGTVGVLTCALAISACLSTNAPGAAASSTSGGAASSTGSASSSSTSSGATGGAISCPYGTPSATDSLAVKLTGTLDGATVDDLFQAASVAGGSGSELVSYQLPACGGAAFLLDPASAYSADGGACSPDGAGCDSSHPCCNNNCDGEACNGNAVYTGLFRMPTPGSDGGEWFCAGSGNASFAEDGSIDFSLSEITRLGACPGKPVSGSVTVCIGVPGSGTCSGVDRTITSTLAGASFAWSNPLRDFSGNLSGPQAEIVGEFAVTPEIADGAGSKLLIEYGGLAGLVNSDGKVTGGVLGIGPGNPDAGAVYCIGGGTAVQQPDGRTYQFTLTSLSRLGTCAGTPVTGSIDGHVSP
jgi:hypothetical protein